MPYTIKPGSFKYKKSNGQFSEIDCFEGPDLTEEVAALEKGKAPIIIDSATGNPIAIKDGADGLPIEGMKIHFTPKQDLHGYDSPWPAGGGKNLVNIAPVKVTSQTTIGGAFSLKAGTYSFSLTAKNNTAIPGAMKITVNGSQVGTSGGIYANTTNRIKIQNITLDSDSSNVGIVISASTAGYDIDISDVQVETGSSSTDFAPYSNICPITGWQGLTAWRTGKNLIDDSKKAKSGSNIYIGTETANTPGIILPPGTYTVAFVVTENLQRNLYMKDADTGEIIPGFPSYQAYSTSPAVVTFTLSKTTRLVVWTYNTSYTGTSDVISVMLNVGSTPSPYTEYAGASYPVTFPDGQTIYGGTLDAVNGVLTVDKAQFAFKDLVALNGASANWVYNSTYNLFETQNAIIPTGTANTETGIVCSCYQSRPYGYNSSYSSENSIVWAHTSGTLRIKDNRYTDVDVWKTAIADEQIVIPLATPYEIQLDPITITTLLGDNMIWSDANSTIELDYRADTKLFVDKNNPVTDVQVNSTSILDNGIANIPKAGLGVFGAVKVANNYGLDMTSSSSSATDGYIRVYPALDADIKNGGNGNYPFHRPITPYNQHKSVFYGLAKLAGADMSSSSNAVGTFTPEAIVAIQKMLKIYQSPWELIRQDSVTNETSSDIEITVDGNGIPLALTDLVLQLTIPANSDTIISSYGLIHLFYYTGADTYVPVMLNNFSGPKQHAWFGSVYANCVNGFVQSSCSQYSESGNNRPVMIRNTYDFFPASSSAIIKIIIKNVQGTIEYKLYGRRKWTT